MASTIRIKRSSVRGKTPNTSNLSTGELALNLADKKIYTSNGTSVFELGSDSFTPKKTFTVTNAGAGAYIFSGLGTGEGFANSNPTLYLTRGETYTFSLNASGHPFYINTVNGTGTSNQFANGVSGQGTQVGDITFTVPMNAPKKLYYNCQYHGSMNGTIYIPSEKDIDASTFQTKSDAVASNNSILTLIEDRLQVANAASTYATISTVNSNLANTNAYIASTQGNVDTLTSTVNSNLANTNAYIASTQGNIDTLSGTVTTLTSTVNSNLANTNAYIASTQGNVDTLTGTVNSNLANTNAYIASNYTTLWSAITSTNTSIRSSISSEVAGLVDSAPSTLDTLNELAAALGDDANFSTTVTNLIATKISVANAIATFANISQLDNYLQVANATTSFTTDSLTVGLGGFRIANGSIVFPTSGGASGQVLKTDGAGNLFFDTVEGNSNGSFVTAGELDRYLQVSNASATFATQVDLNTKLDINPTSLTVGSGTFAIGNGAITFPNFDGANNQILTTDGQGQLRFASLEQATPGAGYDNSTVTEFPTGDYGSDESYIGDPSIVSLDAFGVSIGGNVFDCMDPVGRIVTEDLGTV